MEIVVFLQEDEDVPNVYRNLKVRGPFVQTLCIEKESCMDAIERVNIYLNDALLFQNKENKILFGAPQKAQGYERS